MSSDLVFFGGTGDLSWRKLMPALFQAFRHGTLKPDTRILAVARDTQTDEQYRNWLKARFNDVDIAKRPSDEEFAAFSAMVNYQAMDLSQSAHYQRLRAWVQQRDADVVVMYLATSPHLFTVVCEQLAAANLNTPRTRLVLEKPLGHDLASANAINAVVRATLPERQVFRIDHYLGKPSVQNLMALRFGNVMFEPLWRREWIANFQITLAEDLGVEKRGGYYDGTGALRDMIQNHALQLLCALAMEPPINAHADAIRDEKLKVLRSLVPLSAQDIAEGVVRGQYRAGNIDGHAVPGYLDETGVPAGSACETYVAIRAQVANWRWAGVPFYLRTGKRMAERTAQIVVNFRHAPHSIFGANAAPNKLVIKLQPEDALELHLLAQAGVNADGTPQLRQTFLDLDFDKGYATQRVGAYERLLTDVIGGRLNLFVRSDEQEEAWRWVQPLLDSWKNDNSSLRPYNAGTWGPPAASAMIARDGFSWAEEAP